MQNPASQVVTLSQESPASTRYDSHPIAQINDHEIRISTMTEDYHWHCHPDSDETFLSIESGIYIDLDDGTVELKPGQMFTVGRGVRHRTRPVGKRSVNLVFERVNVKSVALPAPEA